MITREVAAASAEEEDDDDEEEEEQGASTSSPRSRCSLVNVTRQHALRIIDQALELLLDHDVDRN